MARDRYYDGPPSDHFDGIRFFNPGQASTDRGLSDMLRWKLGGRAAKWPGSVPIVSARPERHVDGLRITMVGHASRLVQAAGCNIVTDPVWSERASPFRWVGPKRVTAPSIAFDDLPPIDIVFSHGHYEHRDAATWQRLHAFHDPLMMPLGNDVVAGRPCRWPVASPATGGNGWRSPTASQRRRRRPHHWSNRWPATRE